MSTELNQETAGQVERKAATPVAGAIAGMLFAVLFRSTWPEVVGGSGPRSLSPETAGCRGAASESDCKQQADAED